MPYSSGDLLNTDLNDLDRRVSALEAAMATPTLSLSGPLTYASNAASGTLVATIGNVPAGATPTLTPNDGRLVVAGSQSAGWKVVTGMTASSAGSFTLTVAATGANSTSKTVTVTAPAVTPLPSGIAAMWDAASLSSLADGAAVTSWTDGVGNSTTAYTSDTTAQHTYVKDSGGGLPAVRLSGAGVLTTSGTNAANTAMAADECGVVVIARNFQSGASGNPCLVASGTGTGILLQARPAMTGLYSHMYACADAGMRSIGFGKSKSNQFSIHGVNGSWINGGAGAGETGGQITIGGWQNVGTQCCGKADVLAILVFNRAPTALDLMTVHRHYCDVLGQAYPGGNTAKTIVTHGDSQTQGNDLPFEQSWVGQMVVDLNLPFGTFHQMAHNGWTFTSMTNNSLPLMGDISSLTGTETIVPSFEWANQAQFNGSAVASTSAAAKSWLQAVRGVSPKITTIFATSIDRGDSFGLAHQQDRVDYNNYWDTAANRTGLMEGYVQIHMDPNIGVIGSSPTGGNGNTYFETDDLHPTQAGHTKLYSGPYGFKAAIQARLAA